MPPARRAERGAGILAGATLLAVVTLLAGAARGSVEATVGSAAQAAVRIDVATWRAAPAPSGGTHLGIALVPSWTTQGGDAVAVFDVINVGEVALATQTIVVRDAASGDAPSDRVDVTACAGGVWSSGGATCPGTAVPLGDAADGPLATGVPLEPGARVSVRLSARRATVARSQLAVDVTVDRGAVRPPATTSG